MTVWGTSGFFEGYLFPCSTEDNPDEVGSLVVLPPEIMCSNEVVYRPSVYNAAGGIVLYDVDGTVNFFPDGFRNDPYEEHVHKAGFDRITDRNGRTLVLMRTVFGTTANYIDGNKLIITWTNDPLTQYG